MTMRHLIAAFIVIVALAGAVTAQNPATQTLRSGIDVSGLDRRVRPQDDFFQFVNGEWLARTTIPPDRRLYGTSEVLRDTVRDRLTTILEEASAHVASSHGAVRQMGTSTRASWARPR